MATPWRRLSGPCLKTQPWTTALVDGQQYLFKGMFSEEGYEVLVWDTCTMLTEKVGRDELMKKMKTLNPSIEAPVPRILSNLTTLFRAPLTTFTLTTPTVRGEGKTLIINGTMSGLPFTWHFQCQPAESNTVQDHLVIPLLSTVSELSRQKRELVGIIKRKDLEIQNYKEEGASLSRRHLKTEPFDEKAFDNEMTVSEEFEKGVRNLTEILNSENFQTLYSNVGMVNERQKAEGSLLGGTSWKSTLGDEEIPPSHLPTPHSPSLSTSHSPVKRPHNTPPPKDEEMNRREALERKLEEERVKGKKKKKRLM